MKLPNHTALKEWAAVISALGSGDQFVLIRKGGIADSRFGVEADRFYLFPTYLHQEEKQFKPAFRRHLETTRFAGGEPSQVSITTWCEVVETMRVRDLSALNRLDPYVVFTDATLQERFRFREDQAVHVIAVRAHLLPRPVSIASRPSYAGCRSWISVDDEIDVTGSRPVLDESDLQRGVAAIRDAVAAARPARAGSR